MDSVNRSKTGQGPLPCISILNKYFSQMGPKAAVKTIQGVL